MVTKRRKSGSTVPILGAKQKSTNRKAKAVKQAEAPEPASLSSPESTGFTVYSRCPSPSSGLPADEMAQALSSQLSMAYEWHLTELRSLEASHLKAQEFLGQFGAAEQPEEAYALLHQLEDMMLRLTETLGAKMQARVISEVSRCHKQPEGAVSDGADQSQGAVSVSPEAPTNCGSTHMLMETTRRDSKGATAQDDDHTAQAAKMANSILKIADRFVKNGELTHAELSTYLPGTEHEDFLAWFTHSSSRRQAKFDFDKNGSIDQKELVKACSAFLEQKPTRPKVSRKRRGGSKTGLSLFVEPKLDPLAPSSTRNATATNHSSVERHLASLGSTEPHSLAWGRSTASKSATVPNKNSRDQRLASVDSTEPRSQEWEPSGHSGSPPRGRCASSDYDQGSSASPTHPVRHSPHLMQPSPDTSRELVQRLFDMIDHTGTGAIDVAQLRGVGHSGCGSWRHSELHSWLHSKGLASAPSAKLSLGGFNDFLVLSLENCFERLDAERTGRLEPSELQAISWAFNQKHDEIMQKFGDQIVGVAQFVQFVLELCVRCVDYRESMNGLSQLMQMGARKLVDEHSPERPPTQQQGAEPNTTGHQMHTELDEAVSQKTQGVLKAGLVRTQLKGVVSQEMQESISAGLMETMHSEGHLQGQLAGYRLGQSTLVSEQQAQSPGLTPEVLGQVQCEPGSTSTLHPKNQYLVQEDMKSGSDNSSPSNEQHVTQIMQPIYTQRGCLQSISGQFSGWKQTGSCLYPDDTDSVKRDAMRRADLTPSLTSNAQSSPTVSGTTLVSQLPVFKVPIRKLPVTSLTASFEDLDLNGDGVIDRNEYETHQSQN